MSQSVNNEKVWFSFSFSPSCLINSKISNASELHGYKVRALYIAFQTSAEQVLISPDAFIPYLAMNYFDRFLSRHTDHEDFTFIHYLSSHIALSAFLAAAKIVYPSVFKEIAEGIESKIGLQMLDEYSKFHGHSPAVVTGKPIVSV
ncbi:hypothetical protein RYX36_008646 [Vicia faba]